MKLTIRTLILGATVAGLALSATPSLAQGRGGGNRPAPPSAEERAKARAEMLETLDLSADQTTQVEEVLSSLDEKRKTLMDEARESGDREAMKEIRDEMKEIQDSADTKLKSIMSEEQYAKYVELRSSRGGNRGERRPRGGGRR